MDSVLYQRIAELCAERKITINKLESDLGMGNSVIRKWRQSTPSAEKTAKVATYFNVLVDYLLGITDVRTPVSELLGDEYIITLQRGKERMTPQDQTKSLKMIKLAFGYAFEEN
jgi:transcriptional regulator with XRE-family HTH domain